jgi:hypothetical protein
MDKNAVLAYACVHIRDASRRDERGSHQHTPTHHPRTEKRQNESDKECPMESRTAGPFTG